MTSESSKALEVSCLFARDSYLANFVPLRKDLQVIPGHRDA